MPDRMRGNEYRNTIVCIDSYENRVMQGHFHNLYMPDPVAFKSTLEFLQAMEDMLESLKLPQSFTVIRGFSKRPEETVFTAPAGEQPVGARATFNIRILFRQNSSWQGNICWVEGKLEQCFRSVLELLFLMDSGLSGGK